MGRPANRILTDEEVASMMEVPVGHVRARCRLSFFCGAKLGEDGKTWQIPQKSLEAALATRVEPHWSISTWAGLLDVGYNHLHKITQAVTSLDVPLKRGKSLRALLVPLGETKPLMRIPEREIIRLLGGKA